MNHNQKVDYIIDALDDVQWLILVPRGDFIHTGRSKPRSHFARPSIKYPGAYDTLCDMVIGPTFYDESLLITLWVIQKTGFCAKCMKTVQKAPNRYGYTVKTRQTKMGYYNYVVRPA